MKTKNIYDVYATITIPVSIKVEADNLEEAIDKGLYDIIKWIESKHEVTIHNHDIELGAVYDDLEDEQVY